ncbi:MAG: phosphonate ABC transporter ATP-binding protein [Caulobacteraceae bacterium]|nr:phosphonate ABC transporter ATP-binding protein [Caulobacter sp.]
MHADTAFAARDVVKTYGARRALDGVSLSVARGEMVALIGPSGSGKSTLLRALTGLVCVDPGGEVDAVGLRVQRGGKVVDDVRRVRKRVGFIFQQFNLVGRLTLFSNVMIGCLGRIGFWRGLFGRWPSERKAEAMAALARMGVADYAGQRANTLSGGQQQRGAIARCLVQGATAILADEPVASLDPVSARRVMESLQALNRDDGLSVIVTLHHVEYAVRYCRRVVALQAGRILYDGPTAGLTRDLLVSIYGPEFEEVAPLEPVTLAEARPPEGGLLDPVPADLPAQPGDAR